MKAIYWFRSDLRIADNPNLNRALKEGAQLAFVYVLEDRNWSKAAEWRRKFILESVVELRERLLGLGSELILLHGDAQQRLTELCEQIGTHTIYAMREPAWDEQQIEERLSSSGLHLKFGWDGFPLRSEARPRRTWPSAR